MADIYSVVTGNGASDSYHSTRDEDAQIVISGTFQSGATATAQIRKGGTDFVAPDDSAILTKEGAIRLPVKDKTQVRVLVADNASNVLKISIS